MIGDNEGNWCQNLIRRNERRGMSMREFIQRMYLAIQEGNVELFDDIEDEIKRGNKVSKC